MINEARTKGVRLAIATTTTPANVSALLRYSLDEDSEQWFDVIAAGDIVPAKKPAPDIYFYALEMLGLEAGECLAFEDSHNGILSSRGAGLATIITVNDYTMDHDFDGALVVLDNMGEPDKPFKVIQGDIPQSTYLNVETLRKLSNQA